jgi:hypothetical protein
MSDKIKADVKKFTNRLTRIMIEYDNQTIIIDNSRDAKDVLSWILEASDRDSNRDYIHRGMCVLASALQSTGEV